MTKAKVESGTRQAEATNDTLYSLKIPAELKERTKKLLAKRKLNPKTMPNVLRMTMEMVVCDTELGENSKTYDLIYSQWRESDKTNSAQPSTVLGYKINSLGIVDTQTKQVPADDVLPLDKVLPLSWVKPMRIRNAYRNTKGVLEYLDSSLLKDYNDSVLYWNYNNPKLQVPMVSSVAQIPNPPLTEEETKQYGLDQTPKVQQGEAANPEPQKDNSDDWLNIQPDTLDTQSE